MSWNPEFVDAVRKLVDAVLIEHCLPVGTEGQLNEEHTVNCALNVLREIRAAQELSSLHRWAGTRLDAHAGDEDHWSRDPTLIEWLRDLMSRRK